MIGFIRSFFASIAGWIRNNRTRIGTELKSFLQKTPELILTGIVFAVVASLLTTWIQEKYDAKENITLQLDNLSNVYIGCNKQWVDEAFGAPQFTGQKDDYLLCAYISDYYVLQIVFDQVQAAQAYLITSLDNPDRISVQITDDTLYENETFILGEISYYDFRESPVSVYGFTSNGNARALYAELYDYRSEGNYYEYYIGSFDYGKTPGDIEDFLAIFDMPSDDIDDEVSIYHNEGVQIITDRKNNYPNTYGVSNTDVDVYDLLFTYDWFNSQQLRNKLNSNS